MRTWKPLAVTQENLFCLVLKKSLDKSSWIFFQNGKDQWAYAAYIN